MEVKEKRQRYIIECDPETESQKKNRMVFIFFPLCMFALGFMFMLYVNNALHLPAWIERLAGIRDPYESSFAWIAYKTPLKVEYEDLGFDDVSIADVNTGDGYVTCEKTNDSYDGLTCSPTAPTDIMVMDILPRKVPEKQQSHILVKLFNTGMAVNNVSITLQAQDGSLYEGTITDLPSCSSQAVFRWTPKKIGEILVTSIVNSDKAVAEESFENNAKAVTILVGEKAPDLTSGHDNDYVEWQEDSQGNVTNSTAGR